MESQVPKGSVKSEIEWEQGGGQEVKMDSLGLGS